MQIEDHFRIPAPEWSAAPKPILLTFDDGPHPEVTPRILDALASRRIRAIFFVVGKRLESQANMDVLRRAVCEGHIIGNHSFSHPRLTDLSDDEIRKEILRTDILIRCFVGHHKLIRPPYGAMNENVRRIALELGYAPMLWNVDTLDWNSNFQPSGWLVRGLSQVKNKRECIVLAHDIHASTGEHCAAFLTQLTRVGRFPAFFGNRHGKALPFDPAWSLRPGGDTVWHHV
jgi:peptidoglycan/xylan/chitin deacetylase (PgdA/CDA1 family)